LQDRIKELLNLGIEAMNKGDNESALNYFREASALVDELGISAWAAEISKTLTTLIKLTEKEIEIKYSFKSDTPDMRKLVSSRLIRLLEEPLTETEERKPKETKEREMEEADKEVVHEEKQKMRKRKEDLEFPEEKEVESPREEESRFVEGGESGGAVKEEKAFYYHPSTPKDIPAEAAAPPAKPAGPAAKAAPKPTGKLAAKAPPKPAAAPSPPKQAKVKSSLEKKAAPMQRPAPAPSFPSSPPPSAAAPRPPPPPPSTIAKPPPEPAPSASLRKPGSSPKKAKPEPKRGAIADDESSVAGKRAFRGEPKKKAEQKKIKRYGDVSVPMEMTEKKEYIVSVSLRVQKEDVVGTPVAMEIVVPEVGPPIIEVLLIGRDRDFKIDQTRRSLIVPLDRDSDILNFRVTPKLNGMLSLTVEFYQEGRLIGRAILKVVVKKKKEPVNEALSSTSVTVASYLGETKLDATLRIVRYENDFFFSLFTPRAQAVVSQQNLFGKATIDTGKVKNLENTMEEAVFNRENPSEALDKLKKIGAQVYNYIPEQIRKTLKSITPKYLMIETGDLLIPWELAFDGEDFLSIKYCLGKRVFDETRDFRPPPFCIGKKILDVLFVGASPKGVPEISVGQEAELFDVYQKTKRIKLQKLIEPKALKEKVLEFLTKTDIVHMTCHGKFDEKEPKESALLLSDNALTADEIDNLQMTNWPLIFANAYSTGAISTKVVGIGGIARSFLEAGAIAFLGPLFEIPDDIAVEFAKEFYNNLLYNDENVGESMLSTRKKLRDQFGGAFWAIFSLYGDPTLTLCKA